MLPDLRYAAKWLVIKEFNTGVFQKNSSIISVHGFMILMVRWIDSNDLENLFPISYMSSEEYSTYAQPFSKCRSSITIFPYTIEPCNIELIAAGAENVLPTSEVISHPPKLRNQSLQQKHGVN